MGESMITVRRNKVYFKGKDARTMKELALSLGMATQDAFTGLLWEAIMRFARQGVFKKAVK
jgi:hypothetical protein